MKTKLRENEKILQSQRGEVKKIERKMHQIEQAMEAKSKGSKLRMFLVRQRPEEILVKMREMFSGVMKQKVRAASMWSEASVSDTAMNV